MSFGLAAGLGSERTSTVPSRERHMGTVIVRYKLWPDRVEENERLVRAVYEQLHRERPEGVHYATVKLPDGVTFMHLVFDVETTSRALNQLDAFKAFSAEVASRCEEPPVPMELTVIGSYDLIP
jgi:hypothetical protein